MGHWALSGAYRALGPSRGARHRQQEVERLRGQSGQVGAGWGSIVPARVGKEEKQPAPEEEPVGPRGWSRLRLCSLNRWRDGPRGSWRAAGRGLGFVWARG